MSNGKQGRQHDMRDEADRRQTFCAAQVQTFWAEHSDAKLFGISFSSSPFNLELIIKRNIQCCQKNICRNFGDLISQTKPGDFFSSLKWWNFNLHRMAILGCNTAVIQNITES